MKSKKLKAVYINVVTFLLSGAVSAQITGSSGDPERQVVDIFNQVLLTFEAQSISEVLLFFVLPLFGFYFINKNIFEVAFENFEERIDRDSWKGTNDDLPTGVKGLAFVVAFITVQVVGVFGTVVLLGLALLAVGAWILSFTGLFGSGAEGSRSGSSSDEDLQSLNNEVQDIKQKLDEAGAKEEDAENSGNAAEAEDAEEEIQAALEEMEDVEKKMGQLLEAEENKLTNAIKEAQDVLKKEQDEQATFLDIENRLKRIGNAVEEIYQVTKVAAQAIENGVWRQETKIPRNTFTEAGKIRSTSFHGGGYSMFDLEFAGYSQNSGFKHVYEDLQGVADDVSRIRNIEDEEAPEVKDEVQKFINEAARFTEAFRIINMLKAELEEAEKEDEMMEKIASDFNSKDILDFANKEEKEEKKLENQLNQLRDMEGTIKTELEQAVELLEEEIEGDIKELGEMNEELKQLDSIGKYLAKLDSLISSYGSKEVDIFNPKAQQNVRGEIEDAINKIDVMKDVMSKIGNVKKSEEQEMEKAEEKIREAVSKTE